MHSSLGNKSETPSQIKKNLKDSTKNPLKLINESSKVAAYKINIKKSIAFLNAAGELSEKEIKKAILLTIVYKKDYL